MKDKFTLSRKENLFLAKKTLVNNIYNSAKLEGVNVTFPQTKTILDGMSVSNVDMDDIQKILNLRNAWRYVFNTIDADFNLEYAKKING
ncbi:filamentation induced by cAMP protein fic, partial [Bacillus atrophaeus]|nr:filamentation induced by cAMP protein fic [Bacillus atrophaeus]